MGFSSGFRPGRQQTSSNLSGSAGMEITGSVEFKDELTVNGVLEVQNTTDASDATGDTGAFRVEGGASIAKKLYVGTDLSVAGDITLDDGGSIKEAGGTAAITISATGEITKLGHANVNPTTGHYLQWDGSKVLFQAVTSGGGADTGLSNTFAESQVISKDVNGEFEALVLQNRDDDADTDGAVSIRFDLEATDGSTVDSGKIIVKQTTDMTSAGASQDSSMTFSTSLNGTLADKAVIDSDGNLSLVVDSSALAFGADGDTTLTHTDGTGLTLNSTNKLTFGDAASFVQQSSNGVLRIDGEATIDLNASTAVTVSNDLKLDSDSAVLGFGVDNDTTLTHTDGTGLTLNGTNKICFNDTSQFIQGGSATVLELGATDEIGLTATLVDMDANLDLDGTANVSGLLTVQTGIVPDAQDGAYLGTTSLQWSDLFMADSAVIGFGDDNEITLTHIPDVGLTLSASAGHPTLLLGKTGTADDTATPSTLSLGGSFNGAGSSGTKPKLRYWEQGSNFMGVCIETNEVAWTNSNADYDWSWRTNATDLMTLDAGTGLLTVVNDLAVGDDVSLTSDGGIVNFGVNGEVTLTHKHNEGLQLRQTNTNAPQLEILHNNATDGWTLHPSIQSGGPFKFTSIH